MSHSTPQTGIAADTDSTSNTTTTALTTAADLPTPPPPPSSSSSSSTSSPLAVAQSPSITTTTTGTPQQQFATRKRRRKRQNPRACLLEKATTTTTAEEEAAIRAAATISTTSVAAAEDFDPDDSRPMSSTDVETFKGKIVYNLDGSTYIIDTDSLANPATATSTVGNNISSATGSPAVRSAAATKVSSTSTTVSTRQGWKATTKVDVRVSSSSASSSNSSCSGSATAAAANPRIHTFRVVSAHDASAKSAEQRVHELEREQQQLSGDNDGDDSNAPLRAAPGRLLKPILMCFSCKLSFGNTKSFSLHANAEHQLCLQEREKQLLNREYSSAIIQPNMDERPQISFLEPLDVQLIKGDEPMADAADIEVHDAEMHELGEVEYADEEMRTKADTATNATTKVKVEATAPTTAAAATSALEQQLQQSEMTGMTAAAPTTSGATSKASAAKSNVVDQMLLQKLVSGVSVAAVSDTADKAAATTTNFGSLAKETTTSTYETKDTNLQAAFVLNTTTTATTAVAAMVADSDVATTVSESTTETLATNSQQHEQQQQLIQQQSPTPSSASESSSSSLTAAATTRISPIMSPTTLTTTAAGAAAAATIVASSTDNLSSNKLTTTRTNSSNNTPPTARNSPKLSSLSVADLLLQQQHQLRLQQRISPPAADTTGSSNNEAALASLLQHQQLEAVAAFAQPAPSLTAHSQLSSLHASLAALSGSMDCEPNSSGAKLLSEFLQHQLAVQQQQQQLHYSSGGGCPEHGDFKGVDCKTCELLELQPQLKSPHSSSNANNTQQRSPTGGSSGAGLMPTNLSISPSTSVANVAAAAAVAAVAQQQQQQQHQTAAAAAAAAGSASSFTIGACSDHINGRPLGVDCARCEMILNSARLNSGVQMSTRNSCKTLKCPQCNWHYKYQETLEIHMREKHPDGESACGYCLAGQQHPRLARGESYSCGYKPYRCEICNYSTTTKGNLSIHMQSDKHLNNMQELNSSQNMVAAAAAAGSKLDGAPKMLLSNNIAGSLQVGAVVAVAAQQQQQQQQQQPAAASSNASGSSCGGTVAATAAALNKPKPSFRCDICSYETSVARNLRIHMTSEKHTHNMAVLQNNIKHIQALSFLQQQHQQATAAAAAAATQQQQHHQQQQQQQQQQQLSAAQTAVAAVAVAASAAAAGNLGQLPPLQSGIGGNFLPEIALADLAYNQALMIQLLQQNSATAAAAGQQVGKTPLKMSPDSSSVTAAATEQQLQLQFQQQQAASAYSPPPPPSALTNKAPSLLLSEPSASNDFGLSPSGAAGDVLEPPLRPDPCPSKLYSCLVCAAYNTNSLDELHQHLQLDRSRCSSAAADIMVIVNNNYICRLCNYKTNLKANFQLHSKTDKHLQKLNYINHIREGGPRNEYKLQYQHLAANTVQLKCNCCDFYSNSMQKLSLHAQHMRHDTMRLIFQHLLYLMQQHNMEQQPSPADSVTAAASTNSSKATGAGGKPVDGLEQALNCRQNSSSNAAAAPGGKVLLCQLCNFSAGNLLYMVQHVKSMRHLQVEQFVCLQRRSDNLDSPSLEDVFKVAEQSPATAGSLTPSAPLGCQLEDGVPKSEHNSPSVVAAASALLPAQMHQLPDYSGLDCSYSPSSSVSSTRSKYQRANTPVGAATDNQLPSVIYKCNNNISCDYFAQTKTEMELHIATAHPQATEPDYISIPTNSAAIQAFQAAVVAATAAAAAAAVQRCPSNKSTGTNADNNDDDCAIAIKKERLELPEEQNKDVPMLQQHQQQQDEKRMSNCEATTTSDSAMEVDNNNSRQHRPPPQQSADTGGEEMDVESASNTDKDEALPCVQCPLCQDSFSKKSSLELHLMRVHSVNQDGLARLLQLVDNSVWQNMPTMTTTSAAVVNNELTTAPPLHSATIATPVVTTPLHESLSYELACQQCGAHCKHEQHLLQHAQKLQHYSVQHGDYRCLAAGHSSRPCKLLYATLPAMIAHYKDTHMSAVISERHVYKYRCKQCSLAFKTPEKLNTHTLYHAMRDATKCALCQRNFRSTQALQKHMEQAHQEHSQPTTTVVDQPASPSSSAAEDKTLGGDLLPDGEAAKTSDADVGNKQPLSVCRSPLVSPPHADLQELKDLTATSPTAHAHISPLSSEALCVTQQQQQHVAAITAALLKQQQQQHQYSSQSNNELVDNCPMSPAEVLHQLQLEPALLTQKLFQQNQQQMAAMSAAGTFPNLTPQNLQSIQSLQSLQQLQQLQLPQLAAAAAASGLPLNPVDMLNLMQFHHLMSLNFMNLAPPLIFGASASAGVGVAANGAHTPQSGGAANSSCVGVIGAADLSRVTGGTTAIGGAPPGPPVVDVLQQQQQQTQTQQTSPASAATQLSSNQKRARTRITDDQLKILRAHFDINNSPSEESIMEMSQKANLPMKVVKHWFRNTLFKERQRNKDSPYNFNNPPSTTLNLEEYERTGQAKVTSLSEPSLGGSMTAANSTAGMLSSDGSSNPTTSTPSMAPRTEAQLSNSSVSDFLASHLSYAQQQPLQQQTTQSQTVKQPMEADRVGIADVQIKTEPLDDSVCAGDYDKQQQLLSGSPALFLKQHQQRLSALASEQQQQELDMQEIQQQQQQQQSQQLQQHTYYNNYETKSESGSSDILSRPQTPNSASAVTTAGHPYASMNELLSQQLDSLPLSNSLAGICPLGNNMGPPKKFQMNKTFEKNSPSSQFDTNSNSSNASSTSSGKRANRTRFTDYQIKVLQEFFENNSYPKDSDLEYLSKLLLLSPRVIVVWFQNARQKQRKIYENQPNNSLYETEEKKHNINYACKKCNLVFQRYYELIRHQKNHCFKEENNKKSAKAQIAAAQIAQNLSSEDSNSSIDINSGSAAAAATLQHQQHVAAVAAAAAAGLSPAAAGIGLLHGSSPQQLYSKSCSSLADFSPSTTPTPPHQHQQQRERSNSLEQQQTSQQASKSKYECDKCKLHFGHYEHFREHQLLHLMNPGLFAPHDTFGSILQSLQQAAAATASQQQSHPPPAKKRKYSETSSNADDMSSLGGASSMAGDYDAASATSNKKYDFLYQYFMQNENNAELKQQFQAQQHQEPEVEMEFLANFYQQCELRKRSNYDFLYQYYMKNEQLPLQQQPPNVGTENNKPHMDFLLQYYQLQESKKFFQLDASTQRIHDRAGTPLHMQQQQSHQLTANNKEDCQNELKASNSAVSTGQSDNNTSDGRGEDDDDKDNECENDGDEPQQQSLNPRKVLRRGTQNDNKYALMVAQGADIVAGAPVAKEDATYDHYKQHNNNHNNPQPQTLKQQPLLQHFRHETYQQAIDNGQQPQKPRHKSPSNNATPIRSTTTAAAATMRDAYFHNLEDFLDASLIENPTQTLHFNDDDVGTTINTNSAATTTDAPATAAAPAIANAASSKAAEASKQPPQRNTSPSSNATSTLSTSTGTGSGSGTTTEKQQNKRLRTTILPDQLNFLYECYQNESNPSRKMLEEIAKKVNLKKRVVQVWYQNSRARERKGQFRQNLHVIHKQCPYCSGIFKVRSALEWHLQAKHADRPEISLDHIADIGVQQQQQQEQTPPQPTTDKADLSKEQRVNKSNNNINKRLQNSTHEQQQQQALPLPLPLDLTSNHLVEHLSITTATEKQTNAVSKTTAIGVSVRTQQQQQQDAQLDCQPKLNDLVTHMGLWLQQQRPLTPIMRAGAQHDVDDDADIHNDETINNINNNSNGPSPIFTSYSQSSYSEASSVGGSSPSSTTTTANSNTNTTPSNVGHLRAQMSHAQIRILKLLDRNATRMPTAIDCQNLSREIGLQKRVIQVWFQNSRAKDKKSRNQRYAISDDSNYDDTTRDGGAGAGGSVNNKLPSGALELRDCNLCQLPQVNIQQHAFSIEHIRKVKELLEQTTANVKLRATSISASDADVDEETEADCEQYAELEGSGNGSASSNAVVAARSCDADVDAEEETALNYKRSLRTFTNICKKLKLQALNYHNNESDEQQISELTEQASAASVGNRRRAFAAQRQLQQLSNNNNNRNHSNDNNEDDEVALVTAAGRNGHNNYHGNSVDTNATAAAAAADADEDVSGANKATTTSTAGAPNTTTRATVRNTKAHTNDIIKQIFNCNQITGK